MTTRAPLRTALAAIVISAVALTAGAAPSDGTCVAPTDNLGTLVGDLQPLSSPGALRDPQRAVNFVDAYDDALGLSKDARHGKDALMKADAQSFFAANPDLFYEDLSGAYRNERSLTARTAPSITIAGDPHLGNFGTYRGPDGHAVYGINDFDQARTGSPEQDLERLATSAAIEARRAHLSRDQQDAIVTAIADRYFKTIRKLRHGESPAFLGAKDADGKVRKAIDDADGVKRADFLDPLTKTSHGDERFRKTGELLDLDPRVREPIERGLREYGATLPRDAHVRVPLEILDVAGKLGSGGSTFGLPRYYALVKNADPSKRPIVLEIKQGLPSSDPAHVVERERTLGGLSNPLTGATHAGGADLLVRELEPEKSRIDLAHLDGRKEIQSVAAQDAEALARAHAAKAGNADAIDRWIGGDADAATAKLREFADAYANQAEADRAAFARSL